ncbi:aldehyde dehydrogenase (NADP(+)) [Marinomonas sp. 15G1-11]|uniref:Aldehyde dehydrogenase (NADP(+)) n=1 Tax=Marinomonas phaeophyticola TaxID=3004091 RepID=A0ABT4JU02_9GAMM|nr:aldehyde dehydrogenase (NADP(+)) [Marinomonas sp. 15G1-11]MCZ2721064.1 aldehyde dehydrogenase (NADP(+)) [Marinomonas sp. 15G1-11]
MSFIPHGKHSIAGQLISSENTFTSSPASGEAYNFSVGTVDQINKAVEAAENAFLEYGYTSRETRAAFLNAIADEIEARGDDITKMGCAETGLPEGRLVGERGRTCSQLRLFAEHLLQGEYLDKRHDKALPERQPLPRPDLRLMQRPIGPVAVFGASNFPLAFSTAGGDTAAALAAGCPVIVKGHGAHPGTAEIVTDAINQAVKKCAMPAGVFSLIQGGNREVGSALVKHPLIKAVGFTGSLQGGRALFDLCAARPEPIPFFGELGSVNPMFLFPNAVSQRGEALAKGWATSLSMGAGQFCTNPGIAILLAGSFGDKFLSVASQSLASVPAQTMLTMGIADAYRAGQKRIADTTGVREVLSTSCYMRDATPYLYATTAKDWLNNETLAEEVFGPLGVVVFAESVDEMLEVAKHLDGQLTCTLHIDDADISDAKSFLPVLERKAGRILANSFPTGVEVCDSMVHGGPYPASTNFGATSVGTMSIRRFLRPVCYQDIPSSLLPEDLI